MLAHETSVNPAFVIQLDPFAPLYWRYVATSDGLIRFDALLTTYPTDDTLTQFTSLAPDSYEGFTSSEGGFTMQVVAGQVINITGYAAAFDADSNLFPVDFIMRVSDLMPFDDWAVHTERDIEQTGHFPYSITRHHDYADDMPSPGYGILALFELYDYPSGGNDEMALCAWNNGRKFDWVNSPGATSSDVEWLGFCPMADPYVSVSTFVADGGISYSLNSGSSDSLHRLVQGSANYPIVPFKPGTFITKFTTGPDAAVAPDAEDGHVLISRVRVSKLSLAPDEATTFAVPVQRGFPTEAYPGGYPEPEDINWYAITNQRGLTNTVWGPQIGDAVGASAKNSRGPEDVSEGAIWHTESYAGGEAVFVEFPHLDLALEQSTDENHGIGVVFVGLMDGQRSTTKPCVPTYDVDDPIYAYQSRDASTLQLKAHLVLETRTAEVPPLWTPEVPIPDSNLRATRRRFT